MDNDWVGLNFIAAGWAVACIALAVAAVTVREHAGWFIALALFCAFKLGRTTVRVEIAAKSVPNEVKLAAKGVRPGDVPRGCPPRATDGATEKRPLPRRP